MAITQADNATGAGNDPPTAVAFNTPCAVNDVLVCLIFNSEATSPGTITVQDTVNTGAYTRANFNLDANSGSGLFIYWKVANAVGTPTVSVTESAVQFGQLDIARYTGFLGTPTADATMNASGPFIGTGTALSCSPIVTNFNNELLITGSSRQSQSFTTSGIAGWTAWDGTTFGSNMYYTAVPTSGTTKNFVGTLGASVSWQNVFAGIYDLPASVAIPARGPMPRQIYIMP